MTQQRANQSQNRPNQPLKRRENPRSQEEDYTEGTPSDHIGALLTGVVMMVFGWVGLFWLVTTQRVSLGPEIWLFFLLLHFAVTGTVLPIVRYLNVRFTRIDRPLPPGGVIVRQSVWVGLFVVVCAWMQIPRVLSVPVVFFLLLVFIVLEGFLRLREINADE
ncbi:MAG: hypothetical protein RLP44_18170 [Aggregatilineales bacterium]